MAMPRFSQRHLHLIVASVFIIPLVLKSILLSAQSIRVLMRADTFVPAERINPPCAASGIDPVYLDMLAEAERLTNQEFSARHNQGERGVCIGPVAGTFERHTLQALRNAKRMRMILQQTNVTDVRVGIMMSQPHRDLLDQCSTNVSHLEGCWLWGNGTLFDDVIILNKATPNSSQDFTREFWLQALSSYHSAPYRQTLFLDSDAYPCPGFEKLFSLLQPFSDKLWSLPSASTVDLAIGIDQFKSGDNDPAYWTPGDNHVLTDFVSFTERNTGTVLWNFHRPLVHQLAAFIPLVADHVYNKVATPDHKVVNDQNPFRVALYLFKRLNPEFNEQIIPMHTSCRSYPGKKYAGIDGFKNGMYPIDSSTGKHCSECSCTPCLINHVTSHEVTINGKMGWERGIEYPTDYAVR